MTFAAPIWLALAGAAALGVLLAHLFSPSVPARDRLPTTRFIPQDAPLAVLRTNRLSDWLLLLLRLAVCALMGFALAGAHVPRKAPARVTIVDASRAIGNVADLRDSARAHAGDVTIVVDSAARRVDNEAIGNLPQAETRGTLSAGLVAAHRALQGFGEGRGDAQLVIVSPFVREEFDSATTQLLARWEGPVSLVRVSAAQSRATHRVDVRAEGDDPVAAALAMSPRSVSQRVRLVRTVPAARDSAWARDSAGVLVLWPAALAAGGNADTAGAVVAGDAVVVARFARAEIPTEGRVVARWNDGKPAATEIAFDLGCIRNVAVPVDGIGDLALRASFVEFAHAMVEPCGGARDFARVELPSYAPVSSAPQVPAGREPLWFALAALGVLLIEQALRERRRPMAAA